MSQELIILVDENDIEIGTCEKLKAHQEGILHRAVSVLIFNSKNELLLHKRASGKYHSADLWTNACCTHPKPGEKPKDAAQRRLSEEMGLSSTLTPVFNFIYKAQLDNGLIENEFDHVFIGFVDELPIINTNEVSDYTYANVMEIQQKITESPDSFTVWFKILFKELLQNHLNNIQWLSQS